MVTDSPQQQRSSMRRHERSVLRKHFGLSIVSSDPHSPSRIQNFIPMGVESYLVLWVFTDECCHPNRFRVELLLIESFQIGRLDFPNRDTLKSTHCFLPNETEISVWL